MSWYRVEIQGSGNFATSAFATDFMKRVGAAYRAAGMPVEARVYHGQSTSGDHIYYLSPVASSVAREALDAFSAVRCEIEPDVDGLRLVAF